MAKNSNVDVITLKDWFQGNHSMEEERQLFLYLDFAMKYVHNRGYCILTFNPSEIEILNNQISHIKYNTLLKMPDDFNYQMKLMNEDIINSATLQILLYSKFPLNTKFEFIKDNFDSFSSFIPPSDVQYYRGVIERGASVYFTEFESERLKRDNDKLKQELNEISPKNNKLKSAEISNMISNDKVNNSIYKKINNIQDSAFINILLYPTVFIVLALVFTFICFIFRYLNI